ncbi:DUF2934 domain-containing protein (plasmid) [Cereibacter azotoformans]|uniref:DUF2934 domain-containing protein n=2 Tax=Cereibacter azotoformans TaxID=43057 RepID=A0A2T5K6B2_9RHOB|nr:DUF2934 domain-containing protein [Cereibacter azotoformans]AXQ95805.1 DUF2934 domain-containing protein [Cereibacter sphaeroides]PTR17922.1 hypothetical protein C8J28_11046 [Cereibacter azotoformans]
MNDREARVRQRAYELWEAEGQPADRDQDFWLRAEAEIAAEAEAAAPAASAPAPKPRARKAKAEGEGSERAASGETAAPKRPRRKPAAQAR